MKKKGGVQGFTIAMFIVVIVVVAFYSIMTNRFGSRPEEQSSSEVDKLLNYDFVDNYPKTVRETVKLHCRYMKCAYNDNFTKEQLYTVNQNIRQLMDTELLAINSEESQLQALENDIQFYIDNKQKYVSYSLAEASQIKYNTENDVEYAKIRVGTMLRVDGATVKGDQEYLLRKDAQGRWKLLGWQADTGSAAAESE